MYSDHINRIDKSEPVENRGRDCRFRRTSEPTRENSTAPAIRERCAFSSSASSLRPTLQATETPIASWESAVFPARSSPQAASQCSSQAFFRRCGPRWFQWNSRSASRGSFAAELAQLLVADAAPALLFQTDVERAPFELPFLSTALRSSSSPSCLKNFQIMKIYVINQNEVSRGASK